MKDEEKEVRTFDCTSGGVAYCYGCYTMTEDKDGYGDWVRKEDYDAICARYAEQIAELERMLEHEANEKAKYKDMLKTSSTQRERQLEREVAMLRDALRGTLHDSRSQFIGLSNGYTVMARYREEALSATQSSADAFVARKQAEALEKLAERFFQIADENDPVKFHHEALRMAEEFRSSVNKER